MADLCDFQQQYENALFKTACQDVARVVSILSLESGDLMRPRGKRSPGKYFHEKCLFFGRLLYMVFVKGYTNLVFDTMPFRMWQIITMLIYLYRVYVLPLWLRLIGYGKHASWNEPPIGSHQPTTLSKATEAITHVSMSFEGRLATLNFGDDEYEQLVSALYCKSAHLAPHSLTPLNPFVDGFQGTFLDHLTGVYKILVSWKQPRYVARAGMFHSVYGTFDYRAHYFFDLRAGRQELRQLIGAEAEELAFLICTSDRIGMLRDLYAAMYGVELAVSALRSDGQQIPSLIGTLPKEGFPLRNHITQSVHVIPAEMFAQFMVIVVADFMEQGALSLCSPDIDICLFQFLRYRYYNDILRFVSPYLRVIPGVWKKYLWDREYTEPTREEVMILKELWQRARKWPGGDSLPCSTAERDTLVSMVQRYPYLAEPRIALGCFLEKGIQCQVLILVYSAIVVTCIGL